MSRISLMVNELKIVNAQLIFLTPKNRTLQND
jgi:hypothetical protein